MRELPRVVAVEQEFPRPQVASIENTIFDDFETHSGSLPDLRGKRVAIAVGSRGISDIAIIVKSVVEALRLKGAQPFIVTAMGSHGGGTSEGQRQILEDYGVSKENVGAPVVASMETTSLGVTLEGVSVLIDREAFQADGIVLVNRIKPHTDFKGSVGSGLLKMIAVGLGNMKGAASFHSWVHRLGHEKLIESRARVLIESRRILCGIAVLENAYHETAHLELLPAERLISREKELLETAKGLMPSLPVEDLDVLVIDRIGKNISGTGMDPNVTGRWFAGSATWQEEPAVKRIVVLGLTTESAGNALGIGIADFCNGTAVRQMNLEVTYLNVLTSQNVIAARLPIHFETTEETLKQAVMSLGVRRTAANVRLIRIRDTLSLDKLEASESLIQELEDHDSVSSVSALREMEFDSNGDWPPLS